MNQIHMGAACESPSYGERGVHAHSSAFRGETVATPIQDLGGPPHRILVVEDDRDIRQLFAEALISSGYLVDTAEDVAAGWLSLDVNMSFPMLAADATATAASGALKAAGQAGSTAVETVRKALSKPADVVLKEPHLTKAA